MDYVTITSIFILFFEGLFIIGIALYSTKRKVVISKQTLFLFFPIFIFLLSLYLTGHIYNNQAISLINLVEAVVASLKSFVFEIEKEYVGNLLNQNIWFKIAFYIAYIMSFITVISSGFAFIKNYVINMIRVHILKQEEVDIIIGFNEISLSYVKNNTHSILWISRGINESQKTLLYDQKIAFVVKSLTEDNVKNFLRKKRMNFILFEEESANYESIISLFYKLSQSSQLLYLYLEVKYKEMEIVRDQYLKNQEKNACPYIKLFSLYELNARKLISEHTIPKYLPRNFFNSNHSIINEKEINVFFLGFGKVNASIFPMFCQNNQLVTTLDSHLKAKPVNYYIVDINEDAVHDKRLDYVLNHYQNVDSDLPPVEPICKYHKLLNNLSSNLVIDEIRSIVENKDAFNFFFVSFGSDFENMEMANWLKLEFYARNQQIFCRLKQARLDQDKIIAFGHEKDILKHEYIVNEKLEQLAKDIDYEYQRSKAKVIISKDRLWNNLSQNALYSNYYHGMSVRYKLNILGFDLSDNEKDVSVSRKRFMGVYNQNVPEVHHYEDYFRTNTKNVIAYGEKLRWNAFHILNGYQPMKLNDITVLPNKSYQTKDDERKRHACLTSYNGLHVLHQKVIDIMAKAKIEVSYDDIEKYRHDYMTFDDKDYNLFDALVNLGYKIVELERT